MKSPVWRRSSCLVMTAVLAGCIENSAPREASQRLEQRNHENMPGQLPSLLSPLRFGMSANEAKSVLSDHAPMYTLVSPSHMIEGGRGKLPNGVECTYGLEDSLVVFISTTDTRIRIQGIGVGSSLHDVREVFPAAQLRHVWSRLWVAGVTNIASMAFPVEDEPIASSRVESVEFRAAAGNVD